MIKLFLKMLGKEVCLGKGVMFNLKEQLLLMMLGFDRGLLVPLILKIFLMLILHPLFNQALNTRILIKHY